MTPFLFLPILDEANAGGDPLSQLAARIQDGSFFEFRLSGPIISSLVIMGIVAILAIIIGIQAHFHDPMKKPKGLLLLAESFVNYLNGWCRNIMGVEPGSWPGYFLCLFTYLFMAFAWSITGFPSVIDYLVAPLCLSIVMFVLIQVTALRYQGFRYFHRYVEPIKLWLPINLITMWTPIISTSLRMFGNCLAGSVVIGLLNWFLKSVSSSVLSSFIQGGVSQIFLGPVVIAIFNLYFGLFSGFIQTLVFASLNGVWIGQEIPESAAMGTLSQVKRPDHKETQNS